MAITYSDTPDVDTDADTLSWAAVTRASGFDTFAATPTSANFAALITDETGSGSLVFATSPTLETPTLGVATATSLTTGTVTLNSTDTFGLIYTNTDPGALGPVIKLVHSSASPAASDVVGALNIYGKDSGGNEELYGYFQTLIVSPTNGAETSFSQMGSKSNGVRINNGLYFANGSATSDMGQSTVNAAGYYINGTSIFSAPAISNTVVTGYIRLQDETNGIQFLEAGGLTRWVYGLRTDIGGNDTDLVWYSNSTGLEMALAFSGGLKLGAPTGGFKGTGTLNATAVYDDNTLLTCYVLDAALDGQIDMAKWDEKVPNREIPAEGEQPASVEVRIHEDARKFEARLGGKYDPLDIDKYAAHWKEKRHLTSMPNEATFDPEKGMAIGSWVQRLIETVEIQAVHIDNLNQRLKAAGL